MKIIYRILKIGFISLISIIILAGFMIKFSSDELSDSLKNISFFNFSHNLMEKSINFFLIDSYKKNIIDKYENYRKDFEEKISSKIEKFLSIKNEKEFIDAIFFYTVSKSSKEFSTFFSEMKDFKDLIIIDRNNNLVYKLKDFPFPLNFTKIQKDFELKIQNGELVISENYTDNTLDLNFLISAIIDTTDIKSFIKNSPFLMAYVYEENTIRNEKFPQNWLSEINLKESTTVYKGIYNLKIFPLFYNSIYIGSIAISYPLRDFASISLLALKIILLLIIIFSIYEIDRFIESKLTKIDVRRKQRSQEKRIRKMKEIPEEIEKEYEQSLSWVEKYIEKTEKEK